MQYLHTCPARSRAAIERQLRNHKQPHGRSRRCNSHAEKPCDTRSRSHRGDRLQRLQHQPLHEVVAGEDLKTNCPAKTSKRVHIMSGRGCGRLVGLFVLRPASTRKRSSDLPCDDLVLARPNGRLPSRPHRPLQPGLSRRQQPTNESTKSARCYRPFLRRRNVRLKPARNSHLKQIVQWSF